MGEFWGIHKYCAVFLALVACHEVVLTHGRQIKGTNHNSSLNTDTTRQENNPPRPTLPNVPSSSAEKKVETDGFGESGANAFRPTTPGNSPGVGHRKFVGEDQDMKTKVGVQSPDFEHFVTQRYQNGFRPTAPGHSPGVGNAFQNKIGDR